MADLPTALYDAEGCRAIDRAAIAGGVDSYELMRRAAAAAWEVLHQRWPSLRRLLVLCGPGNNGGDGYLIAALAARAGLAPTIVAGAGPGPGDASRAADEARTVGLEAQPLACFLSEGPGDAELVVDAVFGTGLGRPPVGDWQAAIESVNRSRLPVLAVDVPSGLDADSGAAPGAAMVAAVTVTFIALKAGLFTGAGRSLAGSVVYRRLDVPQSAFAAATPVAERLCPAILAGTIGRRRRDSHKGDHGHVLVIGGEHGMAGAARMAAEAAARTGAGLVTVATRPEHAPGLGGSRPELMIRGVAGGSDLRDLLPGKTVVAVGPGLGRGAWGRDLWHAVRSLPLPKVVDADALTFLAGEPSRRDDWILTPHPGEAARLLDCRTADVQSDRLAAAGTIGERYGGVCVLKGAGSVVAVPAGRPAICDAGNPGMASGGMGDVLTGIIAGLLAQGLAADRAARLAVWLHAAAGDRCAADEGEIGMLAGDLLPVVRRQLNAMTGPEVVWTS